MSGDTVAEQSGRQWGCAGSTPASQFLETLCPFEEIVGPCVHCPGHHQAYWRGLLPRTGPVPTSGCSRQYVVTVISILYGTQAPLTQRKLAEDP